MADKVGFKQGAYTTEADVLSKLTPGDLYVDTNSDISKRKGIFLCSKDSSGNKVMTNVSNISSSNTLTLIEFDGSSTSIQLTADQISIFNDPIQTIFLHSGGYGVELTPVVIDTSNNTVLYREGESGTYIYSTHLEGETLMVTTSSIEDIIQDNVVLPDFNKFDSVTDLKSNPSAISGNSNNNIFSIYTGSNKTLSLTSPITINSNWKIIDFNGCTINLNYKYSSASGGSALMDIITGHGYCFIKNLTIKGTVDMSSASSDIVMNVLKGFAGVENVVIDVTVVGSHYGRGIHGSQRLKNCKVTIGGSRATACTCYSSCDNLDDCRCGKGATASSGAAPRGFVNCTCMSNCYVSDGACVGNEFVNCSKYTNVYYYNGGNKTYISDTENLKVKQIEVTDGVKSDLDVDGTVTATGIKVNNQEINPNFIAAANTVNSDKATPTTKNSVVYKKPNTSGSATSAYGVMDIMIGSDSAVESNTLVCRGANGAVFCNDGAYTGKTSTVKYVDEKTSGVLKTGVNDIGSLPVVLKGDTTNMRILFQDESGNEGATQIYSDTICTDRINEVSDIFFKNGTIGIGLYADDYNDTLDFSGHGATACKIIGITESSDRSDCAVTKKYVDSKAITGVKINGETKTPTSGVIDLGTVTISSLDGNNIVDGTITMDKLEKYVYLDENVLKKNVTISENLFNLLLTAIDNPTPSMNNIYCYSSDGVMHLVSGEYKDIAGGKFLFARILKDSIKYTNVYISQTSTTSGDITYKISSIDTYTTNIQPTLVSGTNIKTINGYSILGSGNLTISGGSGTTDTTMSDTSTNPVQNKVIKAYIDGLVGDAISRLSEI